MVLFLALWAPALGAQQILETFAYPDGPVPAHWVERSGSWRILNERLTTSGNAWNYLTRVEPAHVVNCVLDFEVVYPRRTGLYFGGACARHDGSATENGFVVGKLQDNANAGNYNRAFVSQRPGSSTWFDMLPAAPRAVGRLFVVGTHAWMQVDADMDGYFEQRSTKHPLTSWVQPSGSVGLSGFGAVEIDNWKYYDAILLDDPATRPKIGTTYSMVLEAPLYGGSQPTPWHGFLSLGNAGILLPDGRGLPLTFDWMLVATIGVWSGMLTPAAPQARLSLRIPNDVSLAGVRLFAAAVTSGSPTGAFGFAAISNDHGFQIVQ